MLKNLASSIPRNPQRFFFGRPCLTWSDVQKNRTVIRKLKVAAAVSVVVFVFTVAAAAAVVVFVVTVAAAAADAVNLRKGPQA